VEAELVEGEGPRVIADVSSYEQMLAALRARVKELEIHGERFDAFAGLPEGYLSKLIGPRPVRRIGPTSFAPVLSGLGLRLLVIEDNAATERLKNQVKPRNPSYVRDGMRAGGVHVVLTDRFMRKIRKKGGENSRKYLGKRLVKQLARKAALARWHRA
jgi:hypothetical protein